MAGRTHKVTVRGEELVEACERRFGLFCPHCEAEDRAGMPELEPLPEREVVEGPPVPSRGRPMTEGRLRSMQAFEWPFRPSVGTPAGWSEAACEEV